MAGLARGPASRARPRRQAVAVDAELRRAVAARARVDGARARRTAQRLHAPEPASDAVLRALARTRVERRGFRRGVDARHADAAGDHGDRFRAALSGRHVALLVDAQD